MAELRNLRNPPQHDRIVFGAYAPGCPHDCFLASTEQPGVQVPHSPELTFLLGRQVCSVCGYVARRGRGSSGCCLWRECSPGRPSCPFASPLPTAAPPCCADAVARPFKFAGMVGRVCSCASDVLWHAVAESAR